MSEVTFALLALFLVLRELRFLLRDETRKESYHPPPIDFKDKDDERKEPPFLSSKLNT